MARPPIIISNGGVAGRLAKGLHECRTQEDAENLLMENLFNNTTDSIVKIIKRKGNSKAPCLYWRLIEEAPYEDVAKDRKPPEAFGTELISINDLVDCTE